MLGQSPHVVHVINRLVPAGAERQLIGLTRRSLLQHRIIELSGGGELTRGAILVRLAHELRGHRPDVVVAWLERAQLAVAAVAKPRTPLVANVRGLPQRWGAGPRTALRLAFARYDHFVTNSLAARARLRAYAQPLELRRFDVIPNGVDADGGARLHRGTARPHVLFIGRAGEAKGLDVLLRALDLLGDEVDATLIGVGVPEAAAASGARPRVRVIGRVTDAWAHVEAADVLVVPSRSEGSPNVILEAFAAGLPVVGTRVGGTPELLAEDRGVLVEPEDPHVLAAAVREVTANPQAAARRAEKAGRYVGRAHAWPRVVGAYDDLFRRVAAR